MTQKRPLLGALLAIAAALLFGINAGTSKVVIESGITAEQVVSVRTAIAAGLTLIWALLRNPRLLVINIRELPLLISIGVVGVGALQWTYSNAVANLPIGIALLIEYTAVLMIPIASMIFFKDRFSPKLWLGALLVIIGLILVSQVWAGGLNPVGVLFAFGAALSLSFYFISAERVQRRVTTSAVMVYAIGTAAILFAFLADWPNFELSRLTDQVSLSGNLIEVTWPQWFLLLWLGFMGGFLPMLLTYLAVTHISSTVMGVISTSEVVFAFAVGFIWLGETIGILQTFGGIVVVVGILIAQTSKTSGQMGETNVDSGTQPRKLRENRFIRGNNPR